jgi:LysM repeat protein
MNRGQLAFLVLVNAMVSLVIALAVVWAFEARRPDPELLAAITTPRVEPVLAAAPTPLSVAGGATTGATTTSLITEAAPVAPTPTPTEAAEEVYVVQPGDTLLVIATRYSLTVDDLLRANNLNNPDFVFAGQRLIIPIGGGGAAPAATSVGAPATEGIQVAAIANVGDLVNEQALVVNESNAAVNLQGWRLERVGGVAYTFRSDVPLFPGGSVRIHSAAGTDSSIDLYWGLTEPVWQSGVEARLINSQGDVAGTFTVP